MLCSVVLAVFVEVCVHMLVSWSTNLKCSVRETKIWQLRSSNQSHCNNMWATSWFAQSEWDGHSQLMLPNSQSQSLLATILMHPKPMGCWWDGSTNLVHWFLLMPKCSLTMNEYILWNGALTGIVIVFLVVFFKYSWQLYLKATMKQRYGEPTK